MKCLKNHLIAHAGKKPFMWHHCGKSSTNKRTLQTHMRIHTRKRSFKCLQPAYEKFKISKRPETSFTNSLWR